MPKFTNTKRIDTINTLSADSIKRLDSPYNILLNLKPYVADYYNQSPQNTTSDESMNIIYHHTGPQSPVRVNKIVDAVMYGLPQFSIDLEIGDFGLEGDSYSGESIVLPNTWIPYPGDYFAIKNTNAIRIFMVNKVNPDTLPNGANYYKVEFAYSTWTIADLEDQVIETFRFIVDNVGTNYSSLVRSVDYDIISIIERKLTIMRKYYKSLFYADNVQTFVYTFDGKKFYDPFMIEFMIRNGIMNDDREYAYIAHALPIPHTFSIEYDRTFLRALEENKKNKNINISAIAQYIDNKLSLFCFRTTDYYCIEYNSTMAFANTVPVINPSLYSHIQNNELYGDVDHTLDNIIIKYFNSTTITTIDVDNMLEVPFNDNIELFYNIPMVIFILEKYILDLIARKPKMDISTEVTYK